MSKAILRRKKSHDALRPSYHFTAPENWLNAPNACFQWKGKYHLFYQHHATSLEWGHAMSEDLVHWVDAPIVLSPTPDSYNEGDACSVCLVNDNGIATMLYTVTEYDEQTFCIATSTDDDLRTWQKYDATALRIEKPRELSYSGFRDPYVWKQDGMWKMVIATSTANACEVVLLYEAETLYDWHYITALYSNDEPNEPAYVCPNFFQLGEKWVLIVSRKARSDVEYFVGLFWNNHFIVESHGYLGNYPFYVPLTFEDNKGRRLMMGCLQETSSESEPALSNQAEVISVPMELMLLENNQLALTPVREILSSDLPTRYYQFHDVSIDDLAYIQEKLPSKRLKVVISDDLSKLIFIDGSVIEFFYFPDYKVRRVYEDEADLTILAEWLRFPLKRIGIWTMPDTL